MKIFFTHSHPSIALPDAELSNNTKRRWLPGSRAHQPVSFSYIHQLDSRITESTWKIISRAFVELGFEFHITQVIANRNGICFLERDKKHGGDNSIF